MKNSYRLVLKLLLGTTIILSWASMWLGQYWYVLGLFSHFQLQFFFVLLVILFPLWFFYKYHNSLWWLGIIYGLWLGLLIFPLNDSGVVAQADIYYQNVLIYNENIDQVFDHIANNDYEIVALVELPKELEDRLATIYRSKVVNGEGGGRCGIFSQKPQTEIIIPGTTYPVCAINTGDYTLLVIHPTPPFDQELLDKQIQYFDEIANIIENLDDQGRKFILVGDFNSAPYPRYFADRFEKYHHHNIYSWQPHRPWSIPIDHALSNFNLEVKKGELLGSDHAGLLIDKI